MESRGNCCRGIAAGKSANRSSRTLTDSVSLFAQDRFCSGGFGNCQIYPAVLNPRVSAQAQTIPNNVRMHVPLFESTQLTGCQCGNGHSHAARR
jgi:hypothetical protein